MNWKLMNIRHTTCSLHNLGTSFQLMNSKANEDYVYAGTSGVHELRMFNVNDGQLCGGVVDLPKSVYTLDQMNTND